MNYSLLTNGSAILAPVSRTCPGLSEPQNCRELLGDRHRKKKVAGKIAFNKRSTKNLPTKTDQSNKTSFPLRRLWEEDRVKNG
jgi:hypothetical protein